MKNSLLKIGTILLFACLIIGFVGYKTGVFEKKEKAKQTIEDTEKDSIEIEFKKSIEILPSKTLTKDSVSMDLIGSSKFRIVLEKEDLEKFKKDTTNDSVD